METIIHKYRELENDIVQPILDKMLEMMTEKEFIEQKIKYYDINQRPYVARHSPKRGPKEVKYVNEK